MGYKVAGIPAFWWAVDDVADDLILSELYEICFQLVEDGPSLPGAESTKLPLPPVVLEGWFLDLPSGSGFIGYGQWSEDSLLLVNLTLYGWATPDEPI